MVERITVQRAFAIVEATPGDFAALVAMRHQEDWAANAWLFAALEASRLGHIVVARREDTITHGQADAAGIVASAVCTAYGEIGVIGNVIVHASHRARGLGRAVMEAELAWLGARGVRCVELDATEDGRPLYEKLGFVERSPSWMLVTTVGRVLARLADTTAPEHEAVALSTVTVPAVGALDRHAFGGDRVPLLAAMMAQEGTRGWAMRDAAGAIAGYLFTRPTERRPMGVRVGPWIARTPDVALRLLRHAVAAVAGGTENSEAAPVLASVPGASEVVTAAFTRAGLPLVPDDVRMRLTLPVATTGASAARADWVFGMLAPMVG